MASRLLLFLCCLFAAQSAVARPPGMRFDVAYTLEHGKYIVELGTPAGPRRFIFDTGSPRTVITESLRDELCLAPVGTLSLGDFEGHGAEVGIVRMDSLRMGAALFRDLETVVLPDSSLIFPCFRVDGIAGCDLLRRFVVRMPNADSTISFATDRCAFGIPGKRRSCRMYLDTGCPHIAVRLCNANRRLKTYVRFDTGSPDFYNYSYSEGDRWLEKGFTADLRWAWGYASSMGWTNRTVRAHHFRATVPLFEIAGTGIAGVPLESTYGNCDILGSRLLDWGKVVLDFPRRRFRFLPHANTAPAAVPQPLYNFVPWIVAGELVVGTVWDETLRDVIGPGDRIAAIGGVPWSGDICPFLLAPEQVEGAACEIVTAAEGRVTITMKKM